MQKKWKISPPNTPGLIHYSITRQGLKPLSNSKSRLKTTPRDISKNYPRVGILGAFHLIYERCLRVIEGASQRSKKNCSGSGELPRDLIGSSPL
jgi:hypothetical protein